MNGKEQFDSGVSHKARQLGYIHLLVQRMQQLRDSEGIEGFKAGYAPFKMDLLIPALTKVRRALITDLEKMGQGDYAEAYLKYLDAQNKI